MRMSCLRLPSSFAIRKKSEMLTPRWACSCKPVAYPGCRATFVLRRVPVNRPHPPAANRYLAEEGSRCLELDERRIRRERPRRGAWRQENRRHNCSNSGVHKAVLGLERARHSAIPDDPDRRDHQRYGQREHQRTRTRHCRRHVDDRRHWVQAFFHQGLFGLPTSA